MTTLRTWHHPSTGAVRVYISGFGQTKLWAEPCAQDQFGFDYTIRAVNSNKNRSELGNLVNEAERALFEAAGSHIKSFADILALASKQSDQPTSTGMMSSAHA